MMLPQLGNHLLKGHLTPTSLFQLVLFLEFLLVHLLAKRLFVLIQRHAVEREVFRPLAHPRHTTLVARHVLCRELRQGIGLPIDRHPVAFGHHNFRVGRRVNDAVAGLHTVFSQVEIGKLGIDERIRVKKSVVPKRFDNRFNCNK